MKSTGEAAPKFGLFYSLCCGHQIAIGQGVRFPDCPGHKGTTWWKELREPDHVKRNEPHTESIAV